MKKPTLILLLFTVTLLTTACGQNKDTTQTDAKEPLETKDVVQTPDTIAEKYLLGQYDPAKEKDFSLIAPKYTNKTGIYMRTEAYDAFIAMRDSALKDGITLTIVSATRTFWHQKTIWENKWNGRQYVGGKLLNVAFPDPTQRALEILKYSSMPGTSRHHWGTDIDINSVDPAYFKTAYGIKVLAWLEQHAPDFGFCRPYTPFGEGRTKGYQPEEWHWTYIPISCKFQEAYKNQIKYTDIEGFDGDETAFTTRVIDNNVFGVDVKCCK
ncbi:MAG: peptidase M15 [Bacteroidetes bacterium HGW-Bacteroidetes-6]|jgi:LAS superfamily LD-carboxypeptidase LdcB|nr:MAG: peptidase M15 [Bacteroidetes bacterium HGW-Bacteroidetes-6]